MKVLKREMEDYRILLRSIPSLIIALFIVSVIMMNLLANKEFISLKYLALDCGFTLSWVSFLCMDIICKRFGPKAAAKISILAIFINACVCLIFWLLSLAPGMWGEYYATGDMAVNTALNNTIGGSWYVVLGSSVAMFCAAVTNSFINYTVARHLKKDNFRAFAIRSFVSTGIAQFVDNFVFATIVSLNFFGWSNGTAVRSAFQPHGIQGQQEMGSRKSRRTVSEVYKGSRVKCLKRPGVRYSTV